MNTKALIEFLGKWFMRNSGLGVCKFRMLAFGALAVSQLASALEVTKVDVVNGQQLVVLGSGFGERSGQAAPVLMDFAEYAYENGELNEHHLGFAQDQNIERLNSDPDTLWVKPSIGSSSEASAPRLVPWSPLINL